MHTSVKKLVGFALVSVACALPATAQEVVQITIETKTNVTIDGSPPVLEIQGRPLGVKYFYDNAQKIGGMWLAWNDDNPEEPTLQTNCWPATVVGTGERGFTCGIFLDGEARF